MQRRNFLYALSVLGALPITAGSRDPKTQSTSENKPEYLELIKFHLPVGPKKVMVSDFYRDVAIPALNRNGLQRIGVFNVKYGPNQPTLYVMIPHPSLESVIETPEKLLNDKAYLSKGESFLNLPLSDPGYIRMEKSLMIAFKDMPKVEAPIAILNNNSRIYELRIYESHSQAAGKRKIEMFNQGGEISIFKKTGLQPVFFAETLFGAQMPNLTYMLAFENMAARDQNWNIFRDHPDWLKLKEEAYYKDTVSNITDIILQPTSFSQI